MLLAWCMLAGATPCNAQVLDLLGAGPAAPAPEAGAGALALADRLRNEAAALDTEDPRARAGAALRRAAAELLARAESGGTSGSPAGLLGRTIAARLTMLDAAISGLAEPVAALIAHDVETAIRTGDLAASPEAALRDTFADALQTLAPAPGPHGWIEAEPGAAVPAFNDVLDACARAGVAEGVRERLRTLGGVLEEGRSWAAYRRSADRTAALLAGAAGALAQRDWVDPAARDALRADFESAASAFLAGESRAARDAGEAGLLRLAAVNALMDGVASLEAWAGGAAGPGAVLRVRAALMQAATGARADPAAERRVLENARAVLALAQGRRGLPAEAAIVRQFRPAWREMIADVRRDEAQMLVALAEALRRADAMTDPGIVAAVSRLRAGLVDLRRLADLSRAASVGESGREPRLKEDWQQVGDRVLELGQRMAREPDRERMLAHLRRFLDRASRYLDMRGEERLAASLGGAPEERPAWTALTAGREAPLRDEIVTRRTLWIGAWTRGEDDRELAEASRLDNLALLMDALDDATRVHAVLRAASPASDETAAAPPPGVAPGAYRPLQDWPGWELAPESLATLAEDLEPRCASAVAGALGPDPVKALVETRRVREDFAAVRLCGRLMALASQRGLGAADPPGSALLELGTGGPYPPGPGASWLAEHRAALADLCRYGAEIRPAIDLGDRNRAETLRALVESRAASIMSSIAPAP